MSVKGHCSHRNRSHPYSRGHTDKNGRMLATFDRDTNSTNTLGHCQVTPDQTSSDSHCFDIGSEAWINKIIELADHYDLSAVQNEHLDKFVAMRGIGLMYNEHLTKISARPSLPKEIIDIVNYGQSSGSEGDISILGSLLSVPQSYRELVDIVGDNHIAVIRFRPEEDGLKTYLCKPEITSTSGALTDSQVHQQKMVISWLQGAQGNILDLGHNPNESLLEKIPAEARFLSLPWIEDDEISFVAPGFYTSPDPLHRIQENLEKTPGSHSDHLYSRPDPQPGSTAEGCEPPRSFCFILTREKTFLIAGDDDLAGPGYAEIRQTMAVQVYVMCRRILREINTGFHAQLPVNTAVNITTQTGRVFFEQTPDSRCSRKPGKEKTKKQKMIVKLPCMQKYLSV